MDYDTRVDLSITPPVVIAAEAPVGGECGATYPSEHLTQLVYIVEEPSSSVRPEMLGQLFVIDPSEGTQILNTQIVGQV